MINTTPRTVVRWRSGQRFQIDNVTPTPFDAKHAQEIWGRTQAAVGPRADELPRFMTDGEIAYVHAIWDTMPPSCRYIDAFWRIMNGDT